MSPCSRSLWSDKYQLRAQLARDSGNPGNSCIHLTDRQTEAVLARRGASLPTGGGGGMSCDESYGFGGANPDPGRWHWPLTLTTDPEPTTRYGFSCARALLHPASLEWLNQGALTLTLTL